MLYYICNTKQGGIMNISTAELLELEEMFKKKNVDKCIAIRDLEKILVDNFSDSQGDIIIDGLEFEGDVSFKNFNIKGDLYYNDSVVLETTSKIGFRKE
jgi:hypothetical protein